VTRRSIAVLIGVAVAALAGCGNSDDDSGGGSPDEAVNGFIDELADGSEGACAYLTEEAQRPGSIPGTDGFAPDVPCEDWVISLPEDAREMLSGATVGVLEETEEEAIVQVTPQTGDPPVAVPLVREGDEWTLDWGGQVTDL
jgi:hypothetical protein